MITLFYEKLDQLVSPFGNKVSVVIQGDQCHYTFNETTKMLSASLIKLPILLYAFEQIKKGNLSFSQKIRISSDNIVDGCGIIQVLHDVNDWSIRDLLGLMINVSDNTATNVLMDVLGIEHIQAWINDHQLNGTSIQRKMMDMEAKKEGKDNFTCAADITHCMELIFSSSNSLSHDFPFIDNYFLNQQFRGKLPGKIEYTPVKIYNKTGEMERISHDTAFIKLKDKRAIVTCMTSGFDDSIEADQLIQKIGERVYLFFNEQV
ncbi:serine hydrolase [Terrilactibacillus sp. BCM23-1]|uniref:Serine hydrolase n=1 Tax=Terrilactibacillus tamarindi TaxID=2599694 RepID=A0A6N8CRT0_9BACI|nr:serine hydrolase [Terrilactibacillus tamarindi]MTT32949.1 serine hydrolase [Terrilactibacillus tamarindi]